MMKTSPEMLSYPELQLFRSGLSIYCVCQECWTGGHKIFPPLLPSTLTVLIPKVLKVLQNPDLFENTDMNWGWATRNHDHSVTDYQTAEYHNKICKTSIVLALRFIDCRYEAVFLLQSITPFFSHKLCSGDHMKAGRSTFLTCQFFFFMQTWILWNIWWLKARKRSQKGVTGSAPRDKKPGDSHHHCKALSIKTLICCGVTARSFSHFQNFQKQNRLEFRGHKEIPEDQPMNHLCSSSCMKMIQTSFTLPFLPKSLGVSQHMLFSVGPLILNGTLILHFQIFC